MTGPSVDMRPSAPFPAPLLRVLSEPSGRASHATLRYSLGSHIHGCEISMFR